MRNLDKGTKLLILTFFWIIILAVISCIMAAINTIPAFIVGVIAETIFTIFLFTKVVNKIS